MRVRRRWRRRLRRAAAPAVLLIAFVLIVATSWSINQRGSGVTTRAVEPAAVTADCLTATSVTNVWCEPAEPSLDTLDPEAPVVSVASRISVASTNGEPVAVMFNAVAQDVNDGTTRPTCVPAAGSTFSVGATAVTCTATDTDGNVGIGRLEVVVTREGSADALVEGSDSAAASGGRNRSLWLLAGGSVLLGAVFLVLGERRRNQLARQRVIDLRTPSPTTTHVDVSQ